MCVYLINKGSVRLKRITNYTLTKLESVYTLISKLRTFHNNVNEEAYKF